MPKTFSFQLSGPSFIGLYVRDVKASGEFYEKKMGFKRYPFSFPNAVQFMTYPLPFAVIQALPGMDLDRYPKPTNANSIWFKTNNSQLVHDALLESGVKILKPVTDGPFGKQFTIEDPDGYAIAIYDRDLPNTITVE
jgi:predicted enzyme related to lactoylglutathione lyase